MIRYTTEDVLIQRTLLFSIIFTFGILFGQNAAIIFAIPENRLGLFLVIVLTAIWTDVAQDTGRRALFPKYVPEPQITAPKAVRIVLGYL